ncbi:cation diffusion facilitator family transporter [Aeromicrobium wangtongii]|uniref:Cation diffusion facilitator family transporter n=1 Tax=Aeromicrobium wangtongii TaxID=2969247 RepID=A0ABY5M4S7_9ACTN|nr:cation diffusion facilitator family transporter [Aeromicrobium wangtongii]MCD9198781.1 cation diffusion facilitator family transporter [Aeromicrobium wangtongii]UUP13178.1 cation diffusion facilitator family transporter [Aeromicrobium wangtongii]
MGHDHAHGTGVQHRGRLTLVLALSVTVLVVEAVVAAVTGSLALLADAGHMLGDSFGILMALAAITVAQRGGGPGSRRTFGYHRTEILAAGLNGLVLLGLAVWVAVHAIGRFGDAPELDGGLILFAGAVGLIANVIGLLLLRDGSKESLNVRGAYLEVLGDALGSVAVLVSAGVILATDWYAADAIASLVIAAMILPRAVSLLKDVVEVLMESSPGDVDLADLRAHLIGTPGVKDVHDLHVWTITSGMPVMSAHVVVDDDITGMDEAHAVLDRLRGCLDDHFDVAHSTFQIEPAGHQDSEPHLHH